MIVNELIVEEDKVTGEQEVSTYNIWGEKGLKKARDKYTSYKKSLVFICCHF